MSQTEARSSDDRFPHADPTQPPQAVPIPPTVFDAHERAVLRWLGMAGFLINSRGTLIAVDPLLHRGSVDSPEFTPFNADPDTLLDVVVNPGASGCWHRVTPSSSAGATCSTTPLTALHQDQAMIRLPADAARSC